MKTPFKILTIALFLSSCTAQDSETPSSGNAPEQNVQRFERRLFMNLSGSNLDSLTLEYPEFFDIYVKNILRAGNPMDPALPQYLKAFTTDPTIIEVYQKSQDVYPNLEDIEQSFGRSFSLYSSEFPNSVIPKLISFISGFSYTIVVDDSLLSFGLDMYLGPECEFYPRLGIPQYKFRKMSRENIVPDAIKAWLSTEYELAETDNDLIGLMVYHGKLLYALDVLMPDSLDHRKINYLPEQLEWCKSNEAEIWFHFVDRELLFVKDNAVFTKYLSESPFTPGFPEGSPGEIGKWVGWQIVRKYMSEHPEISLKQLFENNIESNAILVASNYKPKK